MSKTALLSKSAILAADDLPNIDVECPEWGGTVRLRSLTGSERDAFEAGTIKQLNNNQRRLELRNLRARFVSLCAIDAAGKPLFTEADVAALGAKSALVLERLFDAGRKLSGLSDSDVKELEEGFGDAQSGGSTSA